MASIEKIIQQQEDLLTKYKFIQSNFPDVQIFNLTNKYSPICYRSKLVNSQYTDYTVVQDRWHVAVQPYVEIEYLGEKIKIHSSPMNINLARVAYDSKKDSKSYIKFNKVKFNMSKNEFKKDVFNSCRAAIMKFIQSNPGMKLDTKNLDPSLKKLMVFN